MKSLNSAFNYFQKLSGCSLDSQDTNLETDFVWLDSDCE
jgi:hypothetical protein